MHYWEKCFVKKYILKNAEIIIGIVYLLSAVLLVAAWHGSTNYAMRDVSITIHYLYLAGSLLLYIIGHVLHVVTEKLKDILEQLFFVDIAFAVVFSCLMIRGYGNLVEINREEYLISMVGIAIACVVGIMISFSVIAKEIPIKSRVCRCIENKMQKKWLILLLLIISIIFLKQSGSEPRWDGAYVFHYLQDLWLASIFNIEKLQFCGHISMAFIAINKMLQTIFGDLFLGMTMGTYLLLFGSVCCIYGIIEDLLPKKTDIEYTFLTAIYAFSPFVIGLSGYNYWDYWVITLFPIIIYTAMKRKWMYHFVAVVVFCFTKETAVIAYAAYCVGVIFKEYIETKSILYIVSQKKNWGMLFIGGVWLYFYVVLPNWDGVGSFSIEPTYICNKLKVLFVLNFNWLLSICGLVVLFFLLRKKSKIVEKILPLLVSDFAFVLFSCLFETVNHARYINTHIICLNVLVLVGLGIINSKPCKYICCTIVILLMIASNYKTIDPLTLQVFEQYNIGSDTMISTCTGEYLSDSMVYNQQYRYFDGALNLALEDAVNDNKGVHFFPTMIDRSWFFEGISTRAGINELEIQYWDNNKKKRIQVENEDSISFALYNINSESDIKQILGDRIGYFYSIPFLGTEIMQIIEQDMQVLEEEVFGYRGWKVTRLKFVIK